MTIDSAYINVSSLFNFLITGVLIPLILNSSTKVSPKINLQSQGKTVLGYNKIKSPGTIYFVSIYKNLS